jgi:ATP-dependent Clp protease ATP-binding subunit ClpA
MTTNAGVALMEHSSVGFMENDRLNDGAEELKHLFAPEFRNRLDAIIQFKPLDHDVIRHVVDKFIMELEEQLAHKKVSLLVDDSAREWLCVHGYDAKMGARPMARLIQERVKQPLADELLFGQLAEGGSVRLTAANDSLEFEIHELC